jgi:hypothetical protein
MADSSQHPAGDIPPPGQPVPASGRRALLVTLLIVAGSVVIGVAGGLAWSALAPRAVFSVSSPGVAFVVNPETTAFIAADGWFSIVAGAGGLLIGLAAWPLGVRRHGPVPAAGALAGATLAGFAAAWTGSRIGLAAFRHELSTGRAGQLIRQPPDLGARGALAFWPLAAGLTVGAIELILVLRDRQHRPVLPAHAAPAPREPGHREPGYREPGQREPGGGESGPPGPVGGPAPLSAPADAPPARRSADP